MAGLVGGTALTIEDIAVDTAVCPTTGFALVRSDGRPVTRIAKTAYAPLSPLLRDSSGNPDEWSRWDVAEHRTIYCGMPDQCSYAESLAMFKQPSLSKIKLKELFDDEADGATLADAVMNEWFDRGGLPQGAMPRAWRQERTIYDLTLPEDGWFVDIETAESIAAIKLLHGDLLHEEGVDDLTTHHLHDENRTLTTQIAERVRESVLWDGSLPHGIFYSSKHDRRWRCWAIWLRRVDDGHPTTSEPTKEIGGREIGPPHRNPALKHVTDLFNLKFH